MSLTITVRNYRRFPSGNPLRLELSPGNTAFVGINNSGKSSALRFFYEFRELFRTLATWQPQHVHASLVNPHAAFGAADSVHDIDELFSDSTTEDLRITLNGIDSLVEASTAPAGNRRFTTATGVDIVVARSSNTFRIDTITLDDGGKITSESGAFANFDNHHFTYEDNAAVVNVASIATVGDYLARTLYLGAFRNIVTVGEQSKYYDVRTGQAFVQEWRKLKQGYDRLGQRSVGQVEEQVREVFGFDTFAIDPADDNATLLVRIDGTAYKLNDVGAGIAQFILALTTQ